MHKCSIPNCQSYEDTDKNIFYFKYPLQDKSLLQKWLNQIREKNWKPDEKSEICSTHFRLCDIDRSFSKSNPSLKPNAVPTIFPNIVYINPFPDIKPNTVTAPRIRRKTFKRKKSKTVSDNPIIFLAPPLVSHQLDCNFSLVNLFMQSNNNQSNSERFRTILPKTEMVTFVPGFSFMSQSALSFPKILSSVSNACQKNMQKKTQIVQKATSLSNSKADKTDHTEVDKLIDDGKERSNKVPVLRICINKKYKSQTCKNEVLKDKPGQRRSNDKIIRQNDVSRNGTDEIEIQSASKSVIFRLDPDIGEIVVLIKELDSPVENNSKTVIPDETSEEFVKQISHDNTITCGTAGSQELKQLYSKAQKDCNLLKQHLITLKKKQMEERKKIRILENKIRNLHEQTNLTQKTRSRKFARIEAIVDQYSFEDEEYKILLKETRKTKLKLEEKCSVEIKRRRFSKSNNESEINKKESTKKEINANSDEEAYYEVEFLDPEFMM